MRFRQKVQELLHEQNRRIIFLPPGR